MVTVGSVAGGYRVEQVLGSDPAAATTAAQAATPVPGLPQSRCTRVAGSNLLVPRYWCLATSGRYAIKIIAGQLDTAHQQVAAQCRMLTG